MNRRNNRIQFWMDDAELNKLNKRVKSSGLSRETYLRSLVDGVIPKELPKLDFLEILKNLRQINNNMNQVAIKANVYGFIDAKAYYDNYAWLQEQIGVIIRDIY